MRKSSQRLVSLSYARVEAGNYSVGNDTIPKAGPRHQIHVDEFWIDAIAVSLGHVELFIASGAYFDNRWWGDSPQSGRAFLERGSIDQRCADISRMSAKIAKQIYPRARSSNEIPAVGLTWMEAAAVCRFFGARLPFEAEWEVAMQINGSQKPINSSSPKQRISRWGCELHLGWLEEWTAGAFTTRHWRGTTATEFASADAEFGVCVRGSTQNSLFTHAAYRASADPIVANEFRAFRRVWSSPPTPAQLTSDFEKGRQ